MSDAVNLSMSALAALLYALTYLTFVYLLRYPRNWAPPGWQPSTTSGALFLFTVGAVSLSPDSVDSFAMVTLSLLMATLFYIIAAPAIAFQPASRLTEYLAKSGGCLELILSGPAILVALSTTNTKLQSVIAMAAFIEIAWFLRQQVNNRFSRNYPLNEADLLVLSRQANGNLIDFKRAHNIRELDISSEGVSWNGCGKRTAACPFNLYVNRLGLNTAPCCREHMKDLVTHVANWLTKVDAVHWLEGGTLLGAIRENGALLDWEDDVDISVLLTDDLTWDSLVKELTERGAKDDFFVDPFPRQGFISVSYDHPRPWPLRWERNRMRGEIRADIAVYRQAISHGENVLERCSKKGQMPATQNGQFGVPESVVLPTEAVDFIGGRFPAPSQPEVYLKTLYGDFRKVEYTYVDPTAAKTRAEVS